MQYSSSFLEGIADYVDPKLPFISLSKGLELNTLRMMSQIIPQALKNPRQPFIALSGPSFALELMNKLPTGETVIFGQPISICHFGIIVIVEHFMLTRLLYFAAMVVASKDKKLANAAQQLLTSSHLRISTSRY